MSDADLGGGKVSGQRGLASLEKSTVANVRPRGRANERNLTRVFRVRCGAAAHPPRLPALQKSIHQHVNMNTGVYFVKVGLYLQGCTSRAADFGVPRLTLTPHSACLLMRAPSCVPAEHPRGA